MRRRLLLGLLPAAPLGLLLAGGCAAEPVNIGLVMLAPQGLLDRASGLDLAVFDAAKSKCLPSGHADVPAEEATQRFALDKANCPGGAAWCKTIQLDKDGSTRMFVVTAKNAAGVLAEGCGTAVINQDPIDVQIQVKRFNPPACCGDGRLETGEQCEVAEAQGNKACPGLTADAVCGADCTANEILLSIDNPTQPVFTNGDNHTKSDLALAFGQGAAAYPNALRALFVDRDSKTAKGPSDIHERFLLRDLSPITEPPVLGLQLSLPLRCDKIAGLGIVQDQRSPDLAPVGDLMAVVYASDESVGGIFDIYLSPQTANGCVDTPPCTSPGECATGVCKQGSCAPAVQLNISGAAPGASEPHVAAGPGGSALVTWTRASNIYGRIWNTNGALTPDAEILIASNAAGAHVAGVPGGWNVVYSSGSAIHLSKVTLDAGVTTPVTVNIVNNGDQDQPSIASLGDGRTIVVWHGGGDIFFQRFDAMGVAHEHDQDAPLNTVPAGDQQHPVVAAGANAGNFFAVAWETVDTGSIAARFVGGDAGFGYNSVTGQNDEFAAGHPMIAAERHRPAIAVGGDGYVVIGWQDESDAHHGVYVRRFPRPAE
jgi:hypothetical protein